ncbi:unnamed protein product [Effrenium voratum]|uniref:Uncharacterized protein n=1 Tax=Effrenium voratum TaxID=2562239 RepID=A0AA36ITJ8_9DINO|nr:unnamed protein product [Effrenium voratum]CAJ1392612.1 unnamed protein product [Effrenium voratum]
MSSPQLEICRSGPSAESVRAAAWLDGNKATIPPKAYGARFAVHFTQHAAAEPKDPDSPFSPFSPDARPRHSDRAENTETAERTESQNVTDEKEVSTLPRLFDQGPAVASPLEKWDTDALPRFKLEKSEEAKFNPMPVEIGAKLRLQDPKTEFSEDQVTTEMNALEGQSPFTQRHQCCSSGWLRFCS